MCEVCDVVQTTVRQLGCSPYMTIVRRTVSALAHPLFAFPAQPFRQDEVCSKGRDASIKKDRGLTGGETTTTTTSLTSCASVLLMRGMSTPAEIAKHACTGLHCFCPFDTEKKWRPVQSPNMHNNVYCMLPLGPPPKSNLSSVCVLSIPPFFEVNDVVLFTGQQCFVFPTGVHDMISLVHCGGR